MKMYKCCTCHSQGIKNMLKPNIFPPSEQYFLKQVSWIVEFSILLSIFCLHFVLGNNKRAEQNAAAAIFGFMFPSMNLIIFPLVQGCQLFSREQGRRKL